MRSAHIRAHLPVHFVTFSRLLLNQSHPLTQLKCLELEPSVTPLDFNSIFSRFYQVLSRLVNSESICFCLLVAVTALIALAALTALTILLSFDTLNNRQPQETTYLADRRSAVASQRRVMMGSPIFHFAGPTHISIGRLLSTFVKEDDTEL